MSLRIIEDSEKLSFSNALDLKVFLETFSNTELGSMALYHGENDELTVFYETEVFSNGERAKDLLISGPETLIDQVPESPPLKACKKCGSTDIFFDATADQNGELLTVHDHSDCGNCETEHPELVEVVT